MRSTTLKRTEIREGVSVSTVHIIDGGEYWETAIIQHVPLPWFVSDIIRDDSEDEAIVTHVQTVGRCVAATAPMGQP